MTPWAAVPAPEPRPVVAAFDVDGTLTTRDCVVPFLRRVAGTRRLGVGLGRQAAHIAPALARRDRNALKAQAALIVFRGRPYADSPIILYSSPYLGNPRYWVKAV